MLPRPHSSFVGYWSVIQLYAHNNINHIMCRLFVYIYTFSSPLLSLSKYMQSSLNWTVTMKLYWCMHSDCRWCNMAVCTLTRCNPHLTQSTCVLIAATHFLIFSPPLNCMYIFGEHMVCQVCWVLLGLPSQLAAITQWLYIIDRFWCPWLSTDNHLSSPKTTFSNRNGATKKWVFF